MRELHQGCGRLSAAQLAAQPLRLVTQRPETSAQITSGTTQLGPPLISHLRRIKPAGRMKSRTGWPLREALIVSVKHL
jgi:hypothetical protein